MLQFKKMKEEKTSLIENSNKETTPNDQETKTNTKFINQELRPRTKDGRVYTTGGQSVPAPEQPRSRFGGPVYTTSGQLAPATKINTIINSTTLPNDQETKINTTFINQELRPRTKHGRVYTTDGQSVPALEQLRSRFGGPVYTTGGQLAPATKINTIIDSTTLHAAKPNMTPVVMAGTLIENQLNKHKYKEKLSSDNSSLVNSNDSLSISYNKKVEVEPLLKANTNIVSNEDQNISKSDINNNSNHSIQRTDTSSESYPSENNIVYQSQSSSINENEKKSYISSYPYLYALMQQSSISTNQTWMLLKEHPDQHPFDYANCLDQTSTLAANENPKPVTADNIVSINQNIHDKENESSSISQIEEQRVNDASRHQELENILPSVPKDKLSTNVSTFYGNPSANNSKESESKYQKKGNRTASLA